MFSLKVFSIEKNVLQPESLHKQLADDEAGGYASFEGWVRNNNEGQSVNSLEYEAFEEMGVKEGLKIIGEAEKKFDILKASCRHRVGHLQIGDLAVWVGVSAAHRDAAFKACRYIIDQVKVRLPIWKKEHYISGQAEWVNCEECAHHGHSHSEHEIHFSESEYYKRQVTLPGLAETGQERLRSSRVLVVGAGGLGSPALMYLATAGVGTIGVCDGDKLEASNLHRQILYKVKDVGSFKCSLAADQLRAMNPFVRIKTHEFRINPSNVEVLIEDYDLVLDCTDNFATKFLLNDACWLKGIPLVQASIYQTEGQIAVISAMNKTSCLRCLWPEMPDTSCVGNCAEAGVMGYVAGTMGALQVNESVKFLLSQETVGCDYSFLFDLNSMQMRQIKRSKSTSCPLCGDTSSIREILDVNYQPKQADWELSPQDMLTKSTKLVDIRALDEDDFEFLNGLSTIHMPKASVKDLSQKFSQEHVTIICQTGIRSKNLVQTLRDQGDDQFYSLAGGLTAAEKAGLGKILR